MNSWSVRGLRLPRFLRSLTPSHYFFARFGEMKFAEIAKNEAENLSRPFSKRFLFSVPSLSPECRAEAEMAFRLGHLSECKHSERRKPSENLFYNKKKF